MGIIWLSFFIEHSYQWAECQPKGIVIDGPSFIYTFSKKENIPWMEGGRYWVLRDRLMEFFTSLKSRGIELIVVMEGFDHNRTEKECARIKKREDKNQAIARGLLEAKEISSMPVLSFRVFLMVMEELGVPVLVAKGEADPDIVAIANYYNYPVLANDSDYYMYDIKAGYIQFHRLNWDAQQFKVEMYKLCDFNSQFGLKDPKLSRVIPAVLGNDFIETGLLDKFIEAGIIPNQRCNKQVNLVRYTSEAKNVQQFVSRIREKSEEIAKIFEKHLKKAEEIYDGIEPLSKDDLEAKSLVVPDSGSGVEIPSWLMKHGKCLISVAIEGKRLPGCVIDDPYKPTARLASVDIRKSMYTMMSPLMEEKRVKEIMRNDLSKGGKSEDIKMVNHKVILSPSHTLPSVLDIEGMSNDEKLSVFCRVLGIDRNILDGFDKEWKLVIAAACYWVKKCRSRSYSPNNFKKVIETLSATFVYCSKIRPSINGEEWPQISPDLSKKALHSFACFQCIYIDTVTLNDLLQGCLDDTLSPAFFFDGKFALTYFCHRNCDISRIFGEKIKPHLFFSKISETLMGVYAATSST